MWYEDTPTVWNQGNGHTVYINATDGMVAELEKDNDAKKWVKRCKDKGEYITVATREAVQIMLKNVPPEEIAKAGIAAAVLDVAPPATGTAQAKLDAVRKKLDTSVPPTEYDKAKALSDAFAVEEKA